MAREEIFRAIGGYEGLYEVSDQGNVKSLIRNRILKPVSDGRGYQRIHLHKDGKVKAFLVHRLVGMAFLDNPENLPQINHKDENPANNCASNLEFCTAKYNSNYGNHKQKLSKIKIEWHKTHDSPMLGKTGALHPNFGKHIPKISEALKEYYKTHEHPMSSKIGALNHMYGRTGALNKKSKPVLQLTLEGEFVREWNCAREVERELGFNHANISRCCLGKYKSAYGFLWKYAV